MEFSFGGQQEGVVATFAPPNEVVTEDKTRVRAAPDRWRVGMPQATTHVDSNAEMRNDSNMAECD